MSVSHAVTQQPAGQRAATTRGHVVLTSVGSFGDLHPFIAVALALRSRGIRTVIAASEAYRDKVVAEDLAFCPVAPRPDQLQADTGLDEGGILGRLTTRFIIDKAVTPYLAQTHADLSAAMQGAALVVACNFSMVARITAAELGLPVVSLLLSPCTFLSADEPSYLLEAPWLGRVRALLGRRATKIVLDLRRVKARWQTRRVSGFRRQLGLPAQRGDELLDGPLRATRVYGLYSPILGALPADAPPGSKLAGYTFYDSRAGGHDALPGELDKFLRAGPAPLVFTLGSTGVYAPGRFYEDAATIADRLGMRAVLLVGLKALQRWAHLASASVFVASYAPHSLIFPRAAALIHHGGIGTVGQALRAGRVQLVCPMLGDQADNAERLSRLGVAVRLNHAAFSVDKAEAALLSLLTQDSAVRRAAAIARQLAAEDGAGLVAADIELLMEAG